MSITTIITVGGILLVVAFLVYQYVVIYNKFQYWYHKAKRKFADITTVTQQRIDEIYAFVQNVKKYDIHEYKLLKDVTEARSRWSKETDFNEKAKIASQIEHNFFKLQAVVERYPQVKGLALHEPLGKRISRIESRLREARMGYNRVVQQYNERVNKFPRNIVAMLHGFKELNYLDLGEQPYQPKEIFN